MSSGKHFHNVLCLSEAKGMDINMNERLKQVRKSLKLSQEFVAKQLGMTRTTIVAIEAGTRKVTTNELTMFSNLYGVTTDKLLYGDMSEDKEVKAFRRQYVRRRRIRKDSSSVRFAKSKASCHCNFSEKR